ncbi:hypothetical protein MKO06_13850 [Gramella sp. GC03-9]|uniref:Uncharacterized protein n=1 Tax=Christiangramia oceanisediminis TaxID=2920386 RepID=A0A9X2KZA2_9FLAO|nr:hypothetical protein [Gramella oceanisediminis]MCP9200997.1 hypothetical protein [Gramella oceanisediminis]
MRTIIKFWIGLLVMASMIGCSPDDDTVSDRLPFDDDEYVINLSFDPEFSVIENELSKEIVVYFDKPAIQDGEISLRLHIEEGLAVITEPEAINNIIKLKVNESDTRVSFILKPVDDKIIRGMKILSVVFESGLGNFEKADEIGLSITIIDDELQGRLKSIIYGSGDWEWENLYEYTPSGKIKIIANRSPWYENDGYRDEYFYDAEDRISHIKFAESNGLEGHFKREIFYTWEDNKLQKSELFENDVLKSYSLYEYDSHTRISKKTDFNNAGRAENLIQYTYDQDENLFQETVYKIVDNEARFISKTSYTYYQDKASPFAFNQIFPGEKAESNLLNSIVYQTDEEENQILYTYEFDSNGKPLTRRSGDDILTFQYY